MGLLDPEIRFSTADEFVGGYLVHWHVGVQWPESPRHAPSKLCARGQMPQRPLLRTPTSRAVPEPRDSTHPIHVIFMVAIGRFLPSPSRFCLVEAPAKEWSFNDAPVPWILPAGYRNPNETVPDFLEDDNEAGGPLGKESRPTPLAGASAEVTAVDSAEEEDGFETVDDGEG